MNANALSRLPQNTPDFVVPSPPDILLLETAPVTQIDAKLLATVARKDPVLSRVLLWTFHGWSSKMAEDIFKLYFCLRHEITVHQDCVLWGSSVIIPRCLQKDVFLLLHNGRPVEWYGI